MSSVASLPPPVADMPQAGPSSMATTILDRIVDSHPDPIPTIAALKRSASSAFESPDDSSSRKKLKEDTDGGQEMAIPISEETVEGQALADELEQELQCGCCSALVYRPVLVHPCQHFFCGR